MTEKQLKLYREELKEYIEEVTSSSEKAKEFLFKTGVYNRKGELKNEYKYEYK